MATTPARPNAPAARGRKGGFSPVRYERIVVPLDGTPFAEAALRPAAELAARADAALHVVTALPQRGSSAVMMEPIPVDEAEPVRTTTELNDYLLQVEDRVRGEWECAVSSRLLVDGPTAEALLEFVEEVDGDLVIAATHSHNLLVRTVLGSTAIDLVRGSSCPVLLVPSSDPVPDPLETPLQESVSTVVASVDPLADPSNIALGHAVSWARAWGAELRLVHTTVEHPLPASGFEGAGPISTEGRVVLDDRAEKVAEARLAAMVYTLRAAGVDADSRVLRGSRISDAIAAFVENNDVDLVVAGRSDRSPFARIWMGSESDRLARRVRSAGILLCPLEG